MNDNVVGELTYNKFKIGVTTEGKFIIDFDTHSKEFETYSEAKKTIDDFICLKTVAEYPVFIDIGNYHYEKGRVIALNIKANHAQVEREKGYSRWEYIDNLFSVNSETQTLVGNIMRWAEDVKQRYEAIRELKGTLEHDYAFEKVLNGVMKK